MNEIKPAFSDDQHANTEEVLRSIARLLGRQAACMHAKTKLCKIVSCTMFQNNFSKQTS